MDLTDFTTDLKIVGEYEPEYFPMFREIAFDFEKNRFIIENGEFKIVEGKEALKVWIYLALHTDRYVHDIYSWQYGHELRKFVGQRYSKELTDSEVLRDIKETLLINPYITSVKKETMDFKYSTVHPRIRVGTIYGEVIVDV